MFAMRVSDKRKRIVLLKRLWQVLLGSISALSEHFSHSRNERHKDLHGLDGIVCLLDGTDFDKFCCMW